MGAIALPLSHLFGPDALEYRLDHAEASVAIVEPATIANLFAIKDRLPHLRHVIGVAGARESDTKDWNALLQKSGSAFSQVRTKADDPALIIYTSGTTGPPKGALIPQRVENLLPACKNLGVTHITNGCYRLHPIEWNIGEAAGALAAHCLQHGLTPRQVRSTPTLLADFQRLLVDQHGFVLEWPEKLRYTPRTKADPLGI